jgi:hypothetical protein
MSKDRIYTSEVRAVKKVRRQSQLKRKRSVVLVSCFCVLVTFIALATSNLTLSWLSQTFSATRSQTADSETARIGAIVVQTDHNQCERKFDNYTGRAVEDSQTCTNNITLDAHGFPIPKGTVHRLDAISKSFSGQAN